MKTSTLVSFLTLGLLFTDTLASTLPPGTSDGSPGYRSSPIIRQQDIQDDSEPVLSSEEGLSPWPRTTRRDRFRKQAARLTSGSQAHTTSPQNFDVTSLSSIPHTPLNALQRRHLVRRQMPNVDRRAIASVLHQVEIPDGLSKMGPSAMSLSVRNAHLPVDDPNAHLNTPTHLPHYQSSEATPARNTKRDDDEDLTDIKYLNYALVVEQLLYAYYHQALRRFSEDDFRNAGFPDWVRGRFKEMAEHERMHKEFLESAIVAAGSDHVQPADYDFENQDLSSFIDTSMGLESIAVSAYIGILQFFHNKAYVTAEAAMLADRARQAAWINSAVRKQNPWNTAFETPLAPQHVFTLLSVFFNDETSPKLNKELLPAGLQSFPRLTLSPSLVPGEQAEISFPYSEAKDGEGNFLYIAFMSGAETIFGRVLDREERSGDDGQTRKRHFVEIPRDLASRGVVYVIVLRGSTEAIADVRMDDDSVVAGPAISMFPFDAEGKPI